MNQKIEKGTIYIRTLVGYQKIEATNIHYELAPFAQYIDAVKITFLPKRKKLMRVIREGFQPMVVILEGWGHPEPQSAFVESNPRNKGFFESKVLDISNKGFKNNDTNFETFLNKYISTSQAAILVDSRGFIPKEK